MYDAFTHTRNQAVKTVSYSGIRTLIPINSKSELSVPKQNSLCFQFKMRYASDLDDVFRISHYTCG
ncbi:hypothetical protein A2Z33_02080 [Candidatus Gottesmanbacteria bacterium RBG_16_52_11]|uniref:Uncharacterized protein n=1 Tax=Candidatus Gottesmanbacteria bacterium RBG_16_52_11 TaxID=1798374 RepID=A0A1F5YQT9_9BACT|nr:MAG: hypothetical protein A2Z33_02080 [Candidatus Gottesmanbacteria bacterium RBG_16_52_11]